MQTRYFMRGATLDKVLYPVGSIYMSVDSTNPSELFGGVWEQISGRFLYCTNTSKTTGGDTATGSHTLTLNEIPSHYHSFEVYINNGNDMPGGYDKVLAYGMPQGSQYYTFSTYNAGGGAGIPIHKAYRHILQFIVGIGLVKDKYFIVN